MSRFAKIGESEILVTVEGKSAVKVELQEGKADNKNFELVITEMYDKNGEWSYCKGGVRLDCIADNCNAIIKSIKAMYDVAKASKKDVKISDVKTSDLKTYLANMDEAAKAELLKTLLSTAKKEEPKKKTAKKEEPKEEPQEMSPMDELILTFTQAASSKKKGGKKS